MFSKSFLTLTIISNTNHHPFPILDHLSCSWHSLRTQIPWIGYFRPNNIFHFIIFPRIKGYLLSFFTWRTKHLAGLNGCTITTWSQTGYPSPMPLNSALDLQHTPPSSITLLTTTAHHGNRIPITFWKLCNGTVGFTLDIILNCFISGLHPYISRELFILYPYSILKPLASLNSLKINIMIPNPKSHALFKLTTPSPPTFFFDHQPPEPVQTTTHRILYLLNVSHQLNYKSVAHRVYIIIVMRSLSRDTNAHLFGSCCFWMIQNHPQNLWGNHPPLSSIQRPYIFIYHHLPYLVIHLPNPKIQWNNSQSFSNCSYWLWQLP